MSPYELILQRLQESEQAAGQPAQPMFTPEQVQQRVGSNNQQMNLGILGQLAGDKRVRGAGGAVFKNALQARQEDISGRGILDPLTGEMAVDPAFAAQQKQAGRDSILKQALAYESKREAEAAKAEQAKEGRVFRESLARIASSNRGGSGGGKSGPPLPKPVAGHMWNEDGTAQVPVPGTPAAFKVDDQIRAKQAKARSALEKANIVIGEIDRAKEMVGPMTTGLVGAGTSKIFGGTAFDLTKAVDTVKASIGFQELQAMREASPTGGALGQVAVQELVYLQATLGNLDTRQSPEALTRALDQVRTHFENWKNAVEEDARQQAARSTQSVPGGGGPTPPVQAAPGPVPVAPGGTPTAPAAPARTRMRFNGSELVPVQ